MCPGLTVVCSELWYDRWKQTKGIKKVTVRGHISKREKLNLASVCQKDTNAVQSNLIAVKF